MSVVVSHDEYRVVFGDETVRRLTSVRPDEPGVVGEHDRLHTVAERELLEDVADVRAHRRVGDEELGGDLVVRGTPADEREHLAFGRGQRVEQRRLGRPHRGQGRCDRLQEAPRDRRGEQSVAPCDDPDRLDQFDRSNVLQEEAARPGSDRLDHVLVDVEGREDQDLGRAVLRGQDPRRLDAVQPGHPHVHQDDVRPQATGLLDRIESIGGLPHELDVLFGPQRHLERRAHERLIVGDEDADRHGNSSSVGRVADTRYPPPETGPALSSPPKSATRSRIPRWPYRIRGAWSSSAPSICSAASSWRFIPSSVIISSSDRGRYRTTTSTREGRECFKTFVSPSCTIRYADRSNPTGSGRRTPSIVSRTGTPASRTWSTSVSSSSKPGCGVRLVTRSASGRRRPMRRRISTSASRPVCSMLPSAASASRGCAAEIRCAAPAWATMTLTLCATTSCSSRAMTRRSSATARSARSSRSRSKRLARSSNIKTCPRRIRRPSPRNQAAPTNRHSARIASGSTGSFCIRYTRTTTMTATTPAGIETDRSRYAAAV